MQNSRIQLTFILLGISLLLFTTQCSKKDKTLDAAKDKELLQEYFAAATTGVVSSSENMTYVLHSPINGEIDPLILQKALYVEPNAPGKVTLTNQTVLTFIPDKPLKNGETYTMNIELSKIDPTRFKNKISYQFKTIEQDIIGERQGLYINDDGSYSLILGLKTADVVDVDALKKCFDTQGGEMTIFEAGINSYTVDIKYKNNQLPSKEISFSGEGVNSSSSKWKISTKDLNTSGFTLLSHHYDIDRNQVHIYLSKKISREQDLTGLITVNGSNASYTVSNNKITVFLAEVTQTPQADIMLSSVIKSDTNTQLATDQHIRVSLDVMKPDAQFLSDGNYFPSEGEMKIPIKTRLLNSVRIMVIEIKQENVVHFLAWNTIQYTDMYQLRMYGRPVYDEVVPLNQGMKDKEGWIVYGIDLTDKIKRNPGSIYHISMDFGPEQTLLGCKGKLKNANISSKIPDITYFDQKEYYYNDYYYSEDEDYGWNQKDDPCKPAYYMHRELTQRLFICSDYSIIAKKGANQYHIAVNQLRDLQPVNGAQVTLYNLQGSQIKDMTTDGQGQALFDDIAGDAAVIKVAKDKRITYLSLEENQANTLNEFDINSDKTDAETAFYVYGERDVWRPGDSIFIDMMVNPSQISIPNKLPLQLTFYNPENVIIDKKTTYYEVGKQIYPFTLYTPSSAKTGRYRINIKIGAKNIAKPIRIETVKPNTTETIYTLDNSQSGTVYSEYISGSLSSKYLTGFPLAKAGIITRARIKRIARPFENYGTYNFYTSDAWEDQNIDITETTTDGNGQGKVSQSESLKKFGVALNVSLETETTLPGGGVAKEGKKIKVYPFTTSVGTSRILGKGWNGNHTFDENVVINLISVTDHGKKSNVAATINYVIQKHNTSWWVDKYRLRSEGSFVQNEFWSDVKNAQISINGEGKLTFPKGSLPKGAYRVIFEDESSTHKSDVYFTVYDGKEYIPDARPDLVDIQTDKEDYKTGENIKIKLPFVPGAKVLLSIERGNKIVDWIWHTIADNATEINIPIKPSYAPSAYIHATIMQPYEQTANDLPTRIYGIKHINVNDAEGSLKPTADIAAVLESSKQYTFTVSESSGKAMEYTYALVDEGLLNLTGYDTPDPNKHFNGRYPLLVKTWDIYKYLIAFFKGKFAGIISIGGDNAYHADAIAETNRFKPVVIHKGSFSLAAGSKNKHTITIPNYIGKLRLMIVACKNDHFGNFEKLITVKNPLMVQTQMPRSLNVSDKLSIPVTVLRDDKSINTATLTATTAANMARITQSKAISFGGKDQIVQQMEMEVLNKPGAMKLTMEIAGGNKKMNESTDIFVNYPHPYQSSSNTLVIKPGESQSIMVKPKGFVDVFKSNMSVAGAKFPDFGRYIDDLVAYPYGCLEQTTSAAFGQLYLDKVMKLDPIKNVERVQNLQAAVQRLTKFQRNDGRFYYWDNGYYQTWSDIYAGNLLVEMKNTSQLGTQNMSMLDTWLTAQESIGSKWNLSKDVDTYLYTSESVAQAYRLYILAKSGRSSRSGLNKFASSNQSKDALTWWLIAGAYQVSGYDTKGNENMLKAEQLQKTTQSMSSTFGSEGRDLAIIVEILSKMPSQKKKCESYYNRMVEVFNKQSWASTQEMGYAFIAAYSYFGGSVNVNQNISYSIQGLKTSQSATQKALETMIYPIDKQSHNKPIVIKNTGNATIYVHVTDRFIPSELIIPAEDSDLAVKVSYYNLTQNASNINQVKLGDEISISVTVSNPTSLTHDNLALNVKMPSGWELINPRLTETSGISDTRFVNQDYRDDRVYTYLSLSAGKSQVITFKAKAAFTGDYYMPAMTCEHMYNGSIHGRTASGRVTVR